MSLSVASQCTTYLGIVEVLFLFSFRSVHPRGCLAWMGHSLCRKGARVCGHVRFERTSVDLSAGIGPRCGVGMRPLSPLKGCLLRPLSYPGAARPLMLPLFRLLPYLYLLDRSTAYTGLTSAVAAISMLSSYRHNMSTSVRTMPTFLFCLAFPRLSNHSLASCYKSSPVFLVHVSQFFVYLLRLLCYLLSTILRISQPISKLLTHLLTVLWLDISVLVFKSLVKTIVASDLVSFVIPGP
jgi:hypothetical protein